VKGNNAMGHDIGRDNLIELHPYMAVKVTNRIWRGIGKATMEWNGVR